MCFLVVALLSVVSHLAAGQGLMGGGMQGMGTPQGLMGGGMQGMGTPQGLMGGGMQGMGTPQGLMGGGMQGMGTPQGLMGGGMQGMGTPQGLLGGGMQGMGTPQGLMGGGMQGMGTPQGLMGGGMQGMGTPQGLMGGGMQGMGTPQNAGQNLLGGMQEMGTPQNAGQNLMGGGMQGMGASQGWMRGGIQRMGRPQNAGWGVGAWGSGVGVGTGAIGTGVGIGGTGTGMWPSITRPVNPYFNTTITCTVASGSATIKRAPQQWGWGGRSSQLTGTLVFRSTTESGTFSVVITERSRAEATCTTDGLGPIVGSRPSNPWGRRWGHLPQWGSQSQSNGVLTTLTATPGILTTVDLASANFPYRNLESYAGRSLVLCAAIGESMGQHVCTTPAACCTLGFDNKDAVTP